MLEQREPTGDHDLTPAHAFRRRERASILVAHHDRSVGRPLTRMLEVDGHEVRSTRPRDVLRLVRAGEPDLVVLGLNEPTVVALETCARLASTGHARSSPPLVFCVSSPTTAARRAGTLEAGAVDHLHYPIDPRELRARVGAALRTKARLDALAREAATDPLTGLPNRQHFFELLAMHASSASRYGRMISCLMVDIDHFKEVNDRHGHVAGDDVLVSVARHLDEVCRRADVVARYGGEEFVVLATETQVDAARHLAERLRARIANAVHRLRSFEKSVEVTVTASIGVGRWTYGMSADALLRRADRSLLRAKQQGRDRVVLA